MKILCVVAVAIILVLPVTAHGADGGRGSACIVYGDDYAFMLSEPHGWSSACHVEQTLGVTVALWPASGNWPDARTLMYVTVSKKRDENLDQFIEGDLQEFKKHNPDGEIHIVDPISSATGDLLPVRMTSGLTNGRYEVIAYSEQRTVVLIFALTAKTKQDMQAALPVFKKLIKSYVRIDKVEHTSGTKPDVSPNDATPHE